MTTWATTRLKVWLLLLGVFVLGGVTGASLDSVFRLKASNERQEMRGLRNKEPRLETLKRNLNLSEQQANEIRAILEETRAEYRTLREDVRPRYDTVRQNARARIRALLTPEQQQRFDADLADKYGRQRGKSREP